MYDRLNIGHLPDWRYAGKAADSIIVHGTRKDQGQIIAYLPSSYPSGEGYEMREYIIENGYLIPRYAVNEASYRRREEELLVDRTLRFFYSCEPGLDTIRTGEEIVREFDQFNRNYQALEKILGRAPLTSDYEQLTKEERTLTAPAAHWVGHAVNRMGRLGRIILQNNRDGVKFEFDDAYISTHMPKIQKEFCDLYIKLMTSAAPLVRCVMTRDGHPDRDGVFADLIREMGKPVMAVIDNQQIEESAKPELETRTRENIIAKIGQTLCAIDETATIMRQITFHPNFNALVERAALRSHKSGIHDLNPKEFRDMLYEYTEVCRARACIRSEDADNFGPVSNRLRFLRQELRLHLEALRQAAPVAISNRSFHDNNADQAIALLERGTGLMGEMAELRMPRNHFANDVYQQDGVTEDRSSVGRFKSAVNNFILPSEEKRLGALGWAR